jgi:hypothetical protein
METLSGLWSKRHFVPKGQIPANMLDVAEGAYQQMTRSGRLVQSVGDGWMVWSR